MGHNVQPTYIKHTELRLLLYSCHLILCENIQEAIRLTDPVASVLPVANQPASAIASWDCHQSYHHVTIELNQHVQ